MSRFLRGPELHQHDQVGDYGGHGGQQAGVGGLEQVVGRHPDPAHPPQQGGQGEQEPLPVLPQAGVGPDGGLLRGGGGLVPGVGEAVHGGREHHHAGEEAGGEDGEGAAQEEGTMAVHGEDGGQRLVGEEDAQAQEVDVEEEEEWGGGLRRGLRQGADLRTEKNRLCVQ